MPIARYKFDLIRLPLLLIGLLIHSQLVFANDTEVTGAARTSFAYHSDDPLQLAALPKTKHDWSGLALDTGLFMGTQFIVIGALYAMPVEVSGWTQHDKETPIHKRWKDHTGQLVWDGDAWYINYLLHPYWGGTYYIRAHERGFGETGSFWFGFLLSALFEYGGEALFEPASLQDVIVTPVAGIVVGRWFEEIRAPILLKTERGPYEKWVLWLTDPLGIASRWVQRTLGGDTALSIGALPVSNKAHDGLTLTPTLRIGVRF